MSAPSTTIVPFNNPAILPACAASCKALYDANANCVPPVIKTDDPSAWNQCLCLRPELVPFVTSAAQPCATACTDAAGATSLANWFKSLCSPIAPQIFQTGGNLGTAPGQTTVTGKDGKPTASAIPTATVRPNFGNNGDWISTHWQWVVMLVVLIVGIAGIWIGACIWRRRYLRKKDRQSTLGQKHSGSNTNPSWGPPLGAGPDMTDYSQFTREAKPAAVAEEAGERRSKRWTVSKRT